MKPLDQVVRERIAPPLTEAGFERRGRRFRLQPGAGALALVEVRPFKLGRHEAEFFVELGIQPEIWADFVGGGDAQAGGCLWTDRLLVPGARPPMADHWSFDASDEAAGRLLTETLSARLPGFTALLDPENLLAYARTLPHPGRRISVRPEIAVAALLAAKGPSDELEQRLEVLATDRGDGWAEFDSGFVSFVRGWLAEHPQTRQA